MLNSPFNISVTSEASMVPPPSLNVKIKCDVSGVTWGVTCQTRWKSTEFCLPESSACRMVCKGYDKLYLHHWQGQGHWVQMKKLKNMKPKKRVVTSDLYPEPSFSESYGPGGVKGQDVLLEVHRAAAVVIKHSEDGLGQEDGLVSERSLTTTSSSASWNDVIPSSSWQTASLSSPHWDTQPRRLCRSSWWCSSPVQSSPSRLEPDNKNA